jgi:hypothetical protein
MQDCQCLIQVLDDFRFRISSPVKDLLGSRHDI